jgi:hypothetical protein
MAGGCRCSRVMISRPTRLPGSHSWALATALPPARPAGGCLCSPGLRPHRPWPLSCCPLPSQVPACQHSLPCSGAPAPPGGERSKASLAHPLLKKSAEGGGQACLQPCWAGTPGGGEPLAGDDANQQLIRSRSRPARACQLFPCSHFLRGQPRGQPACSCWATRGACRAPVTHLLRPPGRGDR